MIPLGYLDFVRACMRARGAAPRVFTVSFITCSIFGIFQLFLDLDISADLNEEKEHRHSIVGLTVMLIALVFTFWKFYLFNCSSPQVPAFEAGRVTCCVIGDNWLVNCSTYFSLTLCPAFQLGKRVSLLG